MSVPVIHVRPTPSVTTLMETLHVHVAMVTQETDLLVQVINASQKAISAYFTSNICLLYK